MTATPEATELERPEADDIVMVDVPWITLVWDDPVNLMSYVTFVFVEYFNYPRVEGAAADDAGAHGG